MGMMFSPPRALVWHRTDFRLSDNAAVTAAAASAGGAVAGVVVLPTDLHALASEAGPPRASARAGTGQRRADRARAFGVPPGVTRSSPRRVGHLLQALDGLRAEWEAAGSALFVLQGPAHECLPALAASLGVREVHTAPCLAVDERAGNAAVAHALAAGDVPLVVHDETTLIAFADLPFTLEALPDVFSTYRRQVERACPVRDPLPVPMLGGMPDDVRARARAEADAVLAAPVFQAAWRAAADHDPRASFVPDGRRAAGLERLRQWIWQTDSLARYKDTRDGLMGRDVSSRLSLWLATGALSPREVAAEVRRYEHERVANESTYWLVFELLWRDFFHCWVRRWQGRAFRATGVLGRTPCGRQDAGVFARWCAGETGEPLVDAGMRELQATGQLSNRARQNVASWLTRTAGIDWRWGAAWFEQHLLDYDVGPNWGNWQYVAGVGNDPRNRIFNVRAQAERYDPEGAYRARWLGATRLAAGDLTSGTPAISSTIRP